MKGPEKPKRTREMANYIRCLFQGIKDTKVTDTCFFIHRHKFTQERKVAYSRILCDIRPQKKETHRVQLTVGGHKLTYDGPVSTPAAYLTRGKLHCNSVLSNLDIK